MKRGTLRHYKTLRLAAALSEERPCDVADALGLIEALCNHVAPEVAARGDIGRLTDSEIAQLCGTTRDPAHVIKSLLRAGWLDAHPDCRLVIHDYHEHADQGVKGRLNAAGLRFVGERRVRRPSAKAQGGAELPLSPIPPGSGSGSGTGSSALTNIPLSSRTENDPEDARAREAEGTAENGASPPAPRVTAEDLVAAWNEFATSLRGVRVLDAKRRKAALAALRMLPLTGESSWTSVFDRMSRSPVCTSKKGLSWADFDFAIRPGTAAKVLEGKYDEPWDDDGEGGLALGKHGGGNAGAIRRFVARGGTR